MRFLHIALITTLTFILIGCAAGDQTTGQAAYSNPKVFEVAEEEKAEKYCVITSTSNIDGKNRFEEADDEFLMIDELFSKPIKCETKEDCYDFLLEQYNYRSQAPEFEPYLGCEEKQVTGVEFENPESEQ